MRITTLLGMAVLSLSSIAVAGPFAPAAGSAGSTAIDKDDAGFVQWATGFRDYLPGGNVDDQWKTPSKALGKAVGDSFDVVTLGDGGRITLTFGGRITNGVGADFAVFENSFSDTFLELARVEVSSDGTNFVRFKAISLTANPINGFGSVDPTNIEGFAGKYRQGFGTPFDLGVLNGTPGLDVNNVRYVRIVDVIGNGSAFDDYPGEFGGPFPVYDPYPQVGSAGFDLDAVGVIHFAAAPVPEPSQFVLLAAGIVLLSTVVARRRARAAANSKSRS